MYKIKNKIDFDIAILSTLQMLSDIAITDDDIERLCMIEVVSGTLKNICQYVNANVVSEV